MAGGKNKKASVASAKLRKKRRAERYEVSLRDIGRERLAAAGTGAVKVGGLDVEGALEIVRDALAEARKSRAEAAGLDERRWAMDGAVMALAEVERRLVLRLGGPVNVGSEAG